MRRTTPWGLPARSHRRLWLGLAGTTVVIAVLLDADGRILDVNPFRVDAEDLRLRRIKVER
jgi:hypothetical protein